MFEIATKQQVKLIKVSTPMENHGKDFKLACVLTIEAAFSNKQLDQFATGLRDSLYRMATDADGADLVTDLEAPSVLKYPKMSPFSYDMEGTGYTLLVDYGLGGASDIELIDAKVDSFAISPLEGGTVAIKFNVAVHPEALDVGRLCEMQKRDIDITLTAPAATTVQDLFQDAAPTPKKTKAELKADNLAAAQEQIVAGAAADKTVLNPAAAWPFPSDKAA